MPVRRAGEATDEAEEERTSSEPTLEVEGLSKRFGSDEDAVVAVDDVSFSVERGSVVGLLGPNGAGKTTAIKSILGLVIPDAGSIRIDGVDVGTNPWEAYGHVDAMLEGARNDYWRLTVRENLQYFSSIGGDDPAAVADRHESLLEQFDLAGRADEPVRDLSRGMKQKASLASVLAGDVSLVFLDEPTLGLDVESALTLRRELGRLVDERNLTVVLSSHDMAVIEDVCDRVIIMDDGRIVADDTVEDLLGMFETQGYRVTVRGVDERAAGRIRDGFETVDVERFDDRTRFEVSTDSDGFYRLVHLLEDAGARVDTVETITPDLEEVFLNVTRGDRP